MSAETELFQDAEDAVDHGVESGTYVWLISFADMISLLLTFFVLLVSISEVNPKKLYGISDSLKDTFGGGAGDELRFEEKQENILYRIQDFIQQNNLVGKMVALPHGKGVLIRILGTAMFDGKTSKMLPTAYPILDQAVNLMNQYDFSLMVLGHTDDLPPPKTDLVPTNWELSALRASEVLRYIQEKGNIDKNRLVAIGYADTHPIAENNSETNREYNRRVELIFERKITSQMY